MMMVLRLVSFLAVQLLCTGFQLMPMATSLRRTGHLLNAATISAADVKALREESGAGMMDCKKALVEADGDKEKAAEWLRVKGLASAAKKR
mmetsp:Transcript_21593/g.33130  ORF Transcript_21593/g.33130 Transcript_21593/m.33130 type:complete len:91 (-) Transcript_21593:844-1116(-)